MEHMKCGWILLDAAILSDELREKQCRDSSIPDERFNDVMQSTSCDATILILKFVLGLSMVFHSVPALQLKIFDFWFDIDLEFLLCRIIRSRSPPSVEMEWNFEWYSKKKFKSVQLPLNRNSADSQPIVRCCRWCQRQLKVQSSEECYVFLEIWGANEMESKAAKSIARKDTYNGERPLRGSAPSSDACSDRSFL